MLGKSHLANSSHGYKCRTNKILIRCGFKCCWACGEIKPLDVFLGDASQRSGYGGRCRQCHNAQQGALTKGRGPYADRMRIYQRDRARRRSERDAVSVTMTIGGVDYHLQFSPHSNAIRPHSTKQLRAAGLDYCSHCGQIKTMNEFHSSSKGGSGWCRECGIERARAAREPAVCPYCGKDFMAWRYSSGLRFCSRSCSSNYYADKRRPDPMVRADRERRLNTLRCARRQAAKRQLLSDFTAKDTQFVICVFDNRCAYCNAGLGLLEGINWDHVIPLASPDCPGTTLGNMVPACKCCNSSKCAHPYREWMLSKGYNLRRLERKLAILKVAAAERASA